MKPGRILLYISSSSVAFGGFMMDMNRTHMFNPNWTPHAKFHDAFTINLGFILGMTSLYLLAFGRKDKQTLRAAAGLAAAFYLSMLLSFLYPGAGGLDAEFPELIPRIGGLYLNEFPFSVIFLGIISLGYKLACKDLNESAS